MSLSKSELRALEYRERARQAQAMSDACVLDRTREQHALAATRWTEMAKDQERRNVDARRFLGSAAAAQES